MRPMRSRSRQAGVSLVLLAIVILVGVAIFVAVKLFERHEDSGTRGVETGARFKRAQDTLTSFVALNERLPCPADPASDAGLAVPATASATCTFPKGTLPWATIGASRDDAYDAWGWKISYRVFSGATGLTQAGGASMVNCDTDNGTTPTPSSLAPGGLCGLAHDHTQAQFLAGKGLQVNDFGKLPILTDIAYVLVSHGPTGLGAYTAAGIQKAFPTSVSELANINTTTPASQFMAQAASAAGTDSSSAGFFDDILAFQSLSELVSRANVAARDWPENFVIGYTMDAPTVSAAIGSPASQGTLGTNQIDFGSGSSTASVQGFDAGGDQEITFDTTGGAPALGVSGSGGDLLSSVNFARLRIDFGQPGRKLGIALAHFGTYVVAGITYTEQVQFRFSGGASTVNITKAGCRADGGVATFSIDPGTDFTRLEVLPQAASPPGVSALAVADFKACDASPQACFSNLATAGNPCP